MKAKFGVLLIATLALGAGGATDGKKDIDKLAGTWDLSELKFNGEDLDKLKFKIVFKGNEGVVEGNDKVEREYARIKFKIDPAAKPKQIDITVAAGSQTDAAMEGIYDLKDDELRICVKVFGKDRPTEFAAPDGSSIVYLVLKRQ